MPIVAINMHIYQIFINTKKFIKNKYKQISVNVRLQAKQFNYVITNYFYKTKFIVQSKKKSIFNFQFFKKVVGSKYPLNFLFDG